MILPLFACLKCHKTITILFLATFLWILVQAECWPKVWMTRWSEVLCWLCGRNRKTTYNLQRKTQVSRWCTSRVSATCFELNVCIVTAHSYVLESVNWRMTCTYCKMWTRFLLVFRASSCYHFKLSFLVPAWWLPHVNSVSVLRAAVFITHLQLGDVCIMCAALIDWALYYCS